MANYKQLFQQHMDQLGVKYTELNEYMLKVVYQGAYMSTIPVLVYFDKRGGPEVHLICNQICNVKDHELFALRACNEANGRYYWVKFCVDKDWDVVASLDARIEETTCGEECMTLLKKFIGIVDEAYRIFAGEIWA